MSPPTSIMHRETYFSGSELSTCLNTSSIGELKSLFSVGEWGSILWQSLVFDSSSQLSWTERWDSDLNLPCLPEGHYKGNIFLFLFQYAIVNKWLLLIIYYKQCVILYCVWLHVHVNFRKLHLIQWIPVISIAIDYFFGLLRSHYNGSSCNASPIGKYILIIENSIYLTFIFVSCWYDLQC